MDKVKLFAEGKSDRKFLLDYLKYLNAGNFSENDFVLFEGKDNERIKNTVPDFQRNSNRGLVNLLILDADDDYSTRRNELWHLKDELQINFELFLFPNNDLPGELENLLINIIPENQKIFFDCFKEYEKCISSDPRYFPPNLESQIYTYLESQLTKREKKDRNKLIHPFNRNYGDKRFWNLENVVLNPLKSFLQRTIIL